MVNIVLKGKPVSVNSLYRGRKFLTQRGKDTKEDYGWQANTQYKGELFVGDLNVSMDIYFTSKKTSDIDNVIKATLDSLTGILWEDDRQIIELHAFKKQDKLNPRIEISICK